MLPLKYIELPDFSRIMNYDASKKTLYGDDVFYIQECLNYIYKIPVDIDGYYGIQTSDAIKSVQCRLNLEETGIVDENLWSKIVKREGV